MARAWSSVRICSGLGATGMPPGRKVGIGSVSFRLGLICQVSLTELSSRRKSPTVFIGNLLRRFCCSSLPLLLPVLLGGNWSRILASTAEFFLKATDGGHRIDTSHA